VQLPVELLQSLQGVTGFDETAFRAVHESGQQVTSIRVNPAKSTITDAFTAQEVEVLPVPWCPHGYYLSHRPSFTLNPSFHAGAYYVQEASSMFLWYVLQQVTDTTQHHTVLDLCAAPGGKSSLLSSFFSNGLVVANEVIKSRAAILQENLTKWGNSHTIVTNNDAKDFQRLDSFFDVIVTDAPCSGSGLFRRDPEAIHEWSTDNVQLCAQRQQRIIADVLPALNNNGVFIYSTCSYSVAEDEAILDWLIDHFGMESIAVQFPPEWNIITSHSAKHRANGYRFFPDKVMGEGFFIAAFRKPGEAVNKKRKEATLTMATAKEKQQLSAMVQYNDTHSIFMHNEIFHLFPSAYIDALKSLSAHLYIRQAGIALGSFKGKTFVPEHALALSKIPHHFPVAELQLEQALAYLRKQETHFNASQGWCQVNYQGLGLGWIKQLPNRTNNYYPAEWRILKA